MDRVAELIVKLKHPDFRVRREATMALIKIGSPAVPALMEALQDTSATMRLFAALALGEIATHDPVPTLREALPILRRLRIRDLWSATEMQKAIDQIEAATAGMKDLPLPASAPEPDATSLPRPADAILMSVDGLPIPSVAENVADIPGKSNDVMARSRPWWLRREKRL